MRELSPEVLKVIVDSLSGTIASYTQTEVQASPPFLKEIQAGGHSEGGIAVAGTIRFDSATFSIELIFGISKELLDRLHANMFGTPPEAITPEVADLAGEILNIAFGDMDPKLRKLGIELRSSFPINYTQPELGKMLSHIHSQALVIPFQSGGHTFRIEIYAAHSLSQNWKYDPAA